MVEETKVASWEEGKTQYEGKVVKRPDHLCYICGNEGFTPVRGGLYRCYREMCIYRDERGLTGEIPKRICYVCGRVGETMDKAGEYKGVSLYRCVNNSFCTNKLIKGVKLLYTDQGVIKYTQYPRGTLKDHPLVFLNQLELEELKKQELKERIEQLKDPTYKPTLIEFCCLALQEKWHTHEELSLRFKANISTIKSTVPSIIKKQGFNVITKYNENKVLMYKIEEFKQEQPSTVLEQKVNTNPSNGKISINVGDEAQKDSPVIIKEKEVSAENELGKQIPTQGHIVSSNLTLPPKIKKPYIMTIPKSGLVFNMFELLKTGEFTIKELMEKVGVAEATAKMQLNYHIKNKTVNIVVNGDKYSIK
jgi:hypothetical protein